MEQYGFKIIVFFVTFRATLYLGWSELKKYILYIPALSVHKHSYNVFFNSFPYSTRFFWIGIWSQDCPKNFWYLRQKQSLFRAIFSFSFSPQCSHLLSNKDACIEFANIANVAHAWILVDKIIYRIRSNKSLCRGAT